MCVLPVLNVYKQKNRQKTGFLIVAGTGFEPATSGLWASLIFFYSINESDDEMTKSSKKRD